MARFRFYLKQVCTYFYISHNSLSVSYVSNIPIYSDITGQGETYTRNTQRRIMSTIVTNNEEEIISQLGKLTEELAHSAINENGIFKIGISGGSAANYLTIALMSIKTDFSKWKFFFCDERLVPTSSEDSTYGYYKKKLIGHSEVKEEQFVQIKQGVSAQEAADDYILQMQRYFPKNSLPKFDMLLLGMGPDGHTCSLFPGHPLLKEGRVWVAPITDSPKPPPSRITLTFPVINNASVIVFAMSGEGKADMVKRVFVDKEDLPATMVNPINGKIYWILDKAAAKHLQ